MARRQSRTEAAISDEMMAFQHEFVGRGPDRIRTRIVEELVIVRSFGVFTPAERQLAESFEGRRLIKAMRQQVREAGRSVLESTSPEAYGREGRLRALGHLDQERRVTRRLRARP